MAAQRLLDLHGDEVAINLNSEMRKAGRQE
jgi:hypothetical protein